MTEVYDFIIVGGGTAGPVIANRLANASSKPKVLLLEGGGANKDGALRHPSLRYGAFMSPGLDYGYMSTPQLQLKGRQLPCVRGRGLGGSSATNFSCWLLGHREDFNEWANMVGDDSWRWDGKGGVMERFRKIEALHSNLDDEQAAVVSREAIETHSKDGLVDLTYGKLWSELEWLTFKAAKEFGQPVNGDINSGDPTGFGLGPSTSYKGLRVTGATAYLSSPPANLTILTDTVVSKVLLDESKIAVGVETLQGRIYHATKEVMLCAGSLDTPKILLLSGLGPEAQLSKLEIPVVHNIPSVGKNMKDHCLSTTTILLKPKADIGTNAAMSSIPDPLLNVGTQVPMAWLSSPAITSSPEFHSLPTETQDFLQKVPSFELLTLPIPLAAKVPELLSPGDQVVTFIAIVTNSLSTGSVTLSSSNPAAVPLINLGYVTHPYDRRVAIESLRAAVEFSNLPTFAAITEKRLEGPASDSEDDLWQHVQDSMTSVFHYSGTCQMGREGDVDAVVDSRFRVKGVRGLRVADMSVAPLMINNHTQSTAYLIGETAAEKIIADYSL